MMFVALCGPSGSGKTELCNRLERMDKFEKWQQVTTRPPRHDGEEGYLFLTESEYDEFNDAGMLTCRTSFNGYRYGTLDQSSETKDDAIILTIANAEGLDDLFKFARDNGHKVFTLFVGYDTTEDELKKRKRLERRHIIEKEVIDLIGVNDINVGRAFDMWLDTSNENWPVVHNVAAIIELAADSMNRSVYDELYRLLLTAGTTVEPSDAVYNEMKDLLGEPSTTTAAITLEDFDDEDPQYPSDYLNDRTPENTPASLVDKQTTSEPVQEAAKVITEEAAPVEEDKPIKATPDDTVANYVPVESIFMTHSFEDFVLEEAIGCEIFKDANALQLIIRQFVSVYNGNSEKVRCVPLLATRDGKNGIIYNTEVVSTDTGEKIIHISYNDRLRRVIDISF